MIEIILLFLFPSRGVLDDKEIWNTSDDTFITWQLKIRPLATLSCTLDLSSPQALQNVDWLYPHFIRYYIISLACYQFCCSIYPSAKFSRFTDTISLGIWIWSWLPTNHVIPGIIHYFHFPFLLYMSIRNRTNDLIVK